MGALFFLDMPETIPYRGIPLYREGNEAGDSLYQYRRVHPLIARQLSWARDGKSIYAAVVDIDADIMLLDGMLRKGAR
jgi:hypothetical protein